MSKVLYSKKEKVAYITLNRPKVNVVDMEMVAELEKIWKDFRDDESLWVAILNGAGNNFCAGFDILQIMELLSKGRFEWRTSALFGDQNCTPRLIWKPIISAMDGIVNGTGLWLALTSDLRIATPETSFGLGEARINFPVEFSAFLIRHMPRAIVNELLFTANSISAQRALEVGVINKIVPREHLLEEAEAMAGGICRNGPLAIRAMKKIVEQSWDLDYQSGERFSANVIVPVVNSEDTVEACRAFAEKRSPVWKAGI